MFIVTLPPITASEKMEEIISDPRVGGVRYNAGYVTPFSPRDTIEKIVEMVNSYNKKLWIDLKGRQLRIVQWAVPNYGEIYLNHELEVDCPAKVFFRGNDWSEIRFVRGNKIYVEPQPRYAVGNGQAINVHGENLKIKGYLTDDDRLYVKAAQELRVLNFMLSFVEEYEDLVEVENILKQDSNYIHDSAEFVLKIESPKGLEFIGTCPVEMFKKHPIMAARDDMMINIGDNKVLMLKALEKIISLDPSAIVASRIFSGLETSGEVTMGDLSDIRLMHLMGYKRFMLSDGISQKHFNEAANAWQRYCDIYSIED